MVAQRGAEALVHVELVEKFLDILAQKDVTQATWVKGHLCFVDHCEARSVEVLPEGDVKESRGSTGDIEAEHRYCKHNTFHGVGFNCYERGFEVVENLYGRLNNGAVDGPEAHAGKKDGKDDDDGDRGESASSSGVLVVGVVADEVGGGEEVHLFESFI
jgi:hypothetical protein